MRRFFRDHGVNYFEMIGRFEGNLDIQLRIFSESLSEAFYKGAPIAPPASWHEAFRLLRAAIERSRSRKKFVVFLDELPWIATPRSGCLPELEHFWNAWCSRRDDIILIVCGSAASWMLRKIVKARGGLHDRLTQMVGELTRYRGGPSSRNRCHVTALTPSLRAVGMCLFSHTRSG